MLTSFLMMGIQMGEISNPIESTCRILVGKPEGEKPLGRPRRRWVENIKMDLTDIAWDGMDWIYLAQDREQWRALLSMVMNLRGP
jgi:hypothetical protein